MEHFSLILSQRNNECYFFFQLGSDRMRTSVVDIGRPSSKNRAINYLRSRIKQKSTGIFNMSGSRLPALAVFRPGNLGLVRDLFVLKGGVFVSRSA